MIKSLSPFQGKIMSIILRALICFILFRFCDTRNSFSDLDLSIQTLNPVVTGFKITGNAATDQLGYSVSTAGDINNDGYDDIIVGAAIKSTAYVIYGGEKSAFLDIDLSTTSLNPLTTGFTIKGKSSGDFFGVSVSTAGDINNDGYDDIIIGAFYKNSGQGAAYVIYGGPKSAMPNWDFSSGATLNPTSTGFIITGNAAWDRFGGSVSAAGDINKDGYDDIIVGAEGRNGYQGAAYVIYGGDKSIMSNIDLSTQILSPTLTGFMLTGSAANNYLGHSVSRAGDINKDGYDDIIVGAFGKSSSQGAAYIIYGGPKSAMSNWDFSSGATLNPTSTGFMLTGSAASEQFGASVSTAGDFNKDGYDDIIVGGSKTYVIYGGEKSTMPNLDFSSGATLNPTSTGFVITGVGGPSLSTAGDVNNDGYDDIIVGAGGANGLQGEAYVIYGGAKSTMSNIAVSTLNSLAKGFVITGNTAGDYLGSSVSTAGDIDNDGYDDIIIGAKSKDNYQGAAYVIYASCSKNCKTCSSESQCTDCKSPSLLYKSECFASCPDGTLATSPSLCEDCPAHCSICSSTSDCTKCKNSYISYQSQCIDSCPETTFLSMNTCQDCPAHCNHCTSTALCTECISPLVLYQSQCLKSCPKEMFSSNRICTDCPSYCSSCNSQGACQVCFEKFTLVNSRCVLSSASGSSPSSSFSSSPRQAQEKAIQTISTVTQGVGSVVSVGSAVFPLSVLVSKIVQNTRYLNISVTSDLAEVYKTWQTDMISWDVPNMMSDMDNFKKSPILFAQYDISSPFLVNFWPTLINIIIGFGTFITCTLLQKFCEHKKYEGWAYSLLLKLLAGSFNFALIQTYACLDDILFYLVLDAKTNPFSGSFAWASIICAVLFLALGCLLVFFNFWTVYKYQSVKKQGGKELIEAFNERNKYWELFYSDFNDDNLWSQSFFATLIIRSVLSSIAIAVLYDYPMMQTSYLIVLDGAIILFLYFKTPFNTLRGKLAQYYYEIITLLVHFCAFVLSLQDTFNNPSDFVKLIISTGIIYLNTALVYGAIGFMFIEIYKTISEKTRAGKLKQYETIAIQTGTEDILTTGQDQYLKTETQRRLDDQKSNLDSSDINLESSRIINLKSNFYAESSRELKMDQNDTVNEQDQSTIPIFVRRKLRMAKPKQQKY